MAYTVDTILAAVVAEIAAMTGAPAVTHVLEKAGTEKNVSPPYIVWDEQPQEYYDAPQLGPTTGHRFNPRSLWTVKTNMEIHIWGTTREQVETLRHYEIAALHRCCHGSYIIRSGQRIAGNHALTSDGYGYILNVELHQPILDVTYTTKVITAVRHSTISEITTSTSCGHLTLSGV